MLGSLSLGAQASRGHVRLAEIRRANPWHAADRLGPRSPLGGQARGHGVHTPASATSSSDGGATPPAPVVRYLTILTGASRGLGAAIALTLAERGPPLPAAQPEAGPSGTCSSNTSSNCQGEGRSSRWIHDMVLLASDPGRLDAFVRGKLQQAAGSSNGISSGSRHDRGPPVAAAAPPAAVDGSHSLSSAARPQGHGVTRLHTMCFDLADLDTLESNMRRLLSPAAAVASCAPPRSTARGPSSPSPAEPSTRDAGTPAAGGALGSGAGGVLPMHPTAYTHVLLVHNAGQVGDLLPLEDQSLANMQRQTDLNVTSFTALTAAVLHTFLHTPVVTPDLGCATAAASPAPASASTPASARPQGQHVDQAQQAQQVGRRQISVVNISSVSVDQPYEHFSLYGMGKAARHMVVRCLAHEAALREEAHAGRGGGGAVSSAAGTGVTGGSGAGVGVSAAAGAGGERTAQPLARLRALSYAPGAIDTEMQASAREALPAGRLKAAFEENRRAGRLVDPIATSSVLYDILQADTYDNGAHADYYSATMAAAAAAEAAEAALHPLSAARAAAAVTLAAGTATSAGSGAAAGQVGTATSAVVTGRA